MNLGIAGDATPTNDFATIQDVGLDAIANRVQPRQVATGMSHGVQYLGGDNLYADSGNNQVIVAPNGTPNVLMGNQSHFGEGFYVAKSGVDATTATDPNQFIFNSNQNVFKVVKTGTTTVTVGAGDVYNRRYSAIAHGLNTVPLVLATVEGYYGLFGGPAGRASVPVTMFEEYSTGTLPSSRMVPIGYIDASADATYVYMNVNPGDTSFYSQLQTTYTFRYYILQETAAVT